MYSEDNEFIFDSVFSQLSLLSESNSIFYFNIMKKVKKSFAFVGWILEWMVEFEEQPIWEQTLRFYLLKYKIFSFFFEEMENTIYTEWLTLWKTFLLSLDNEDYIFLEQKF